MSGGSWDYLQWALESGNRVPPGTLERFAARMRELVPADCEAHIALAALIKAGEEYERLFASLGQVFHDVEWLDSGDYGPDQAIPTIVCWPQKPPACDTCRTEAIAEGPCQAGAVVNYCRRTDVVCSGTVRSVAP